MTDKKGYYTVLHLDETAGEQEIKAAFRREVKLYHPDRNDSPEARETYLKLNEAYRVLTDPDARKAYDGNMDGGFIPCCKCGKLCRQPRFILFEENGVRRGGVFCRDCASREQFRAAVITCTQSDFGTYPVTRRGVCSGRIAKTPLRLSGA